MSITRDRWLTAQQGEQRYWQMAGGSTRHFLRIIHEHAWAAEFLAAGVPEMCAKGAGQGRSAFEVGIGALQVGVIMFLPNVEEWRLVGIEPQARVRPNLGVLCNSVLDSLATLNYTHLEGMGETVPQPDASFDLVTCFNVLEHVLSPDAVVQELRRLVKPDGVLLMGESCLSYAGYFKKQVIFKGRDKEHPHAFTIDSLRSMVSRCGFEIFREDPIRREGIWKIAGKFKRRLVLARPK